MSSSIFEKVSPLGFGVMRLPMKENTFERLAYQLIEEAIDLGVNYFDMGYTYQNGYAEKFINETVVQKYKREKFYIATKMPLWQVKNKSDLERIFQEQLNRLGVDYIDYYLAHMITKFSWSAMQKFDIKDFFDRKKEEGKIKHIGFSFHDTPEILEEIIDDYEWEFCQLQINYLDWEIRKAKNLYNIATNKELPIVVMEPLTGGGLTRLPDECKRLMIEKHPDWSMAEWGMRFGGRLPNVAIVLSGMNTSEQIIDNVSTLFHTPVLDDEDINVLETIVDIISKKRLVSCSACGYCLKNCPMQIQIPGLFQAFNEAITFETAGIFFARYDVVLATGPRSESCIQCGRCMSICPQKIDIPKYMSLFNTLVLNRCEAMEYSFIDYICKYNLEHDVKL